MAAELDINTMSLLTVVGGFEILGKDGATGTHDSRAEQAGVAQVRPAAVLGTLPITYTVASGTNLIRYLVRYLTAYLVPHS